jgi:hypothetical protein
LKLFGSGKQQWLFVGPSNCEVEVPDKYRGSGVLVHLGSYRADARHPHYYDLRPYMLTHTSDDEGRR